MKPTNSSNLDKQKLPTSSYFIIIYLMGRAVITFIFLIIRFPYFYINDITRLKIISNIIKVYGIASTIFLISAAIGAFKIKEWGRKCLIIYCCLEISTIIFDIFFRFIHLLPLEDHWITVYTATLMRFLINGAIIYYFSRKRIRDIFDSSNTSYQLTF